ncbi:hypothetical protein KUH03_34890 [Sphingobacterium sp. E70]|uniref:hypothetical protein n=1 Tax=Sphingobacterium sp. E70 TaxID=2853439 RepID=UPI00211BB817|nr:hypothetical protein [Sphingobacterium sp. E70]ULT24174.1 hypothetical protein KUH03_34890 [Sphingobacterium sp. E70]
MEAAKNNRKSRQLLLTLSNYPRTSGDGKKYPGTLEGAVNVDVKAQVTGYLEQIYVKEGDYVTKAKPFSK